MTRQTLTLRPDAQISEARSLMREKAVRRIMIVDDKDALVGVASLGDLAARQEGEAAEAAQDVLHSVCASC